MANTFERGGPKLTEQKLAQAEKKLKRHIPAAYRAFLLRQNGGRPVASEFKMAGPRKSSQEGAVKFFLGIGLDEETLNLDYVLETFAGRVPAWFFPVARDPGGSLIGIAEAGKQAGSVLFWDSDYEAEEGDAPGESNLYRIAGSFDELLAGLG